MPAIAHLNHRPFQLSRWFGLVGLVAIASISVVAALLLSRFLTDRMLRQEAVLTMQFIHSVVQVENAAPFFGQGRGDSQEIRSLFHHVHRMEDVLRVSAHDRARTVIWSTDKELVGRRFSDNPELERALEGELVVHGDRIGGQEAEHAKREHVGLTDQDGYFVEMYFPIRDERGAVMGAVELYKTPHALFEAIQTGERAIWAGAILSGLFLYLVMFWRIRRADALISEQQERLVQSETLAAVGEMGSAVAHGIRNPLAAIRTSAELALDTPDPANREAAADIIGEVDRLETWVRDLLSYARPVSGLAKPVDVSRLAGEALANFDREAARRGIATELRVDPRLPSVSADPLLLGQVIGSVLANAFEALGQGGRIEVTTHWEDDKVCVAVCDDGPGMAPDKLARIFKPFYTTKAKGLGVGLPLAKRIVERFGGDIRVGSAPGKGTTVTLCLPPTNTE